MPTKLVIVLCLLLASLAAQGRSVTITTGDFPPWTGENLPGQGYVNQVISAAFAAVGIEARFVYMPWARAYREAMLGHYDATSYWYSSAEREQEMLFSDPLVYNRTVFFQRRSDPPVRWKNLEDLANYRIAVSIGYTYTPEFHFAINSRMLRATHVNSDLQSLKMLIGERVDLFVSDQVAGLHMARAIGVDPQRLRVVEPELVDVDGYLMASRARPESAELMAQFNRGLALIRSNGTYRRILADILDLDHPSIVQGLPKDNPAVNH